MLQTHFRSIVLPTLGTLAQRRLKSKRLHRRAGGPGVIRDSSRGQHLFDSGDHPPNQACFVAQGAVYQGQIACGQWLRLLVNDAPDLGKYVFGALSDGTSQDNAGRIAEVHQIGNNLPNDGCTLPHHAYGCGVTPHEQFEKLLLPYVIVAYGGNTRSHCTD
ncbi:hypothetical protein ARTHRO9AX_80172 [Arthrobacter sp. 9AX]|nr:hypothetical protein ARTHRO9AX_80172 [Arthrobacter sp. 9AX]